MGCVPKLGQWPSHAPCFFDSFPPFLFLASLTTVRFEPSKSALSALEIIAAESCFHQSET